MIHPQAIVDPKAHVDESVTIGPWSYIGPDVVLGKDTVVHSHAVIKGPSEFGEGNEIFQFASVGEDCQDKKFAGEPTKLIVGDRNIFRECSTVHRGTVQDQSETRIGNDNLFMNYVHVAHDCVVGNHNVFSNNASLAGHVTVGDHVIMAGFSGAHQFCRIGDLAMVAKGTLVGMDVASFTMVSGEPPRARGLNSRGLQRKGYDAEEIALLKQAYRVVFRENRPLQEAIDAVKGFDAHSELIERFVASLEASTRGIVR